MTQNTERPKNWTAAKQGWKVSIVIGLAVLLIRFKALIPLVWQLLVKGGTTHAIGSVLSDLLVCLVIFGGCALFIYAVRTGYRRANQALELNGINNNGSSFNTLSSGASSSSVALHVIGRVSLFINAPILYWTLFLFVLLPQLIKIPNASLRIGTTPALAGAFISMAVIVVLATHIGLLLTKFSFKSIVKVPELAAAPFGGGAMPIPQLPYAQQGAYMQQAVYPVNPQTAGTNNSPNSYGQQGNYYAAAPFQGSPEAPNQLLPNAQQGYVQPGNYPSPPVNQVPSGAGLPPGNGQPRQP